MFARSTTVMARPESIDAGITHIRDVVMPALHEMPGWVGLSAMVDRASGRCISTTSWDSEEAMLDSADAATRLRDRAAEILGGTSTAEHWDIAALHREHSSDPGACVRATWVTLPQDLMDAGIEYFRGSVLPQMEHLPGFCSASLLVDRRTGRGVACASFHSRDALESSRDRMTALKADSMRSAGASEVDEGEFELVIAHLRVPELV
ncbi:antibiotic biosynthesis monooxygenase [Mycolicibacterium diernhoferi]|uniref:ABM domain-containing protein n=1 Tax=Mycolicibacterium diernhoferi TaxID=1801 RepID=A0A1Q4HJ08_9MYCO|nr:antibiotic biosynthesis monooxygenase [Mycolicibacterium diernhoferi]OJZ67452.1 hypothetical protein BRW64_03990 [Mycolicibacterium diernhoferi]OPE44852.1 hypothetical protein BV510_30110 [Mycolicibacterium diernhoferi]PEG54981.1 hypothetical protein CRI78_09120 [Mycolicibacterium diernhoferi]QYL25097.1 antibiotic biosynthesis monooxygenase [Mycolicibacterium diernhoferi]